MIVPLGGERGRNYEAGPQGCHIVHHVTQQQDVWPFQMLRYSCGRRYYRYMSPGYYFPPTIEVTHEMLYHFDEWQQSRQGRTFIFCRGCVGVIMGGQPDRGL